MQKKYVVGGLAIVIVGIWSYVIHSWLNPPVQFIADNDQVAIEYLLDNMCPSLKPTIEYIDGKIGMEDATSLVEECNRGEGFDQALIREFSRHYK